ncbi:PQQ-binding-like beta-propeller repeat protein [Nocardia sp. XZ_19_385]|uniref:serine/threonine-protein kinase n=1 Tax=Nocardia sp. XZ_19_385 TaxID=2769488 RepID=UPI00189024C6|nr:serine/threonine-protein kinase [Nocardia sp. XZ_19_385]
MTTETVGPYTVIGRIGSGGMGDVLLGRSPGGRQVAIKVVHRHLAHDTEFRARFAREVQAARAVGGFYTAAVVDADWEASQPWLATEYIAGQSLKQLVTDFGPLPEESVAELAAGIVEALSAIHSAGVTHRDLTPGNVLLTESGPRVIDFGIAKLITETQSVTATGALIGTPGYMSPEHVLGGAVGPASDVFSLGSVLTLAATGHGPFEDKSTARVLDRVAHAAPNLDGLREGRLYRIIVACLNKDADARPSTADLLEALGDQRTETTPHRWLPPPMMQAVAAPPSVEPVGPERRTSRRMVLAAAGVGLAVVAGVAVASKVAADRLHVKAPAAQRSPGGTLRWKADVGTFVGLDYAPEPPVVAGNAVYTGSIDGSIYAIELGSGSVRWKAPTHRQPAHGPVHSGGKVFAANVSRGLTAFDAATGSPLWEKDGISSAIAADGGLVFSSLSSLSNGIVAFDAATGEQRWSALTDARTSNVPIFAGGGAVVTVTDDGELCLLDAASGAVRWRVRDTKERFYGLNTPIVSGGAVFMSTSSTVRALDIGTGTQLWSFDRFGGSVAVVRGDTVFVSGYDRAYAFDAADGTVKWLYRAEDKLSNVLAVGTDSVYCVGEKRLFTLDSGSGEQRWTFDAEGKLGGVAFGSGTVYAVCDDRNLYAINA